MVDPAEQSRHYRRGAVMGLTVAEAFMLLAFVLLMLMMLWRQEDRQAVEAAKALATLPPAEREAALGALRQLDAAGLGPQSPDMQAKLAAILEVGGGDVAPILAGATEAERRKLQDLIRGSAWRQAPEGEVPTLRDVVEARLEAEAERRRAVSAALRRDLGGLVAGKGGTIEDDGSLVFPENVLFAAGRADITPDLSAFLQQVCPLWFSTLEKQRAAISDLRIEGHASSEWEGASQEGAYLGNLALSQERAYAVLSTCLGLVPGPDGAWARSVATAAGYSSSHPVVVDGQEDKERSRRVVFRVGYSDRAVLDDIGRDVGATAEEPAPVPEN